MLRHSGNSWMMSWCSESIVGSFYSWFEIRGILNIEVQARPEEKTEKWRKCGRCPVLTLGGQFLLSLAISRSSLRLALGPVSTRA